MIRLSPHKPTSGDPGWPKYDLQCRATMRFDTTSEVVDDPVLATFVKAATTLAEK